MEIELGFDLSNKVSNLFLLNYDSASYAKTSLSVVSVNIQRTFLNAATIRLTVTGGKEAGEDYGIGKNFTGSGTWTNASYETNYTTVSFAQGENVKTVTLTIANNPTPEMTRVMTLALSNPSVGIAAGSTKTITIIDDNVDYQLDVTAPPVGWGHDGLVADGGTTDNTPRLQALLDHMEGLGCDKVVLYFPTANLGYAFQERLNFPSAGQNLYSLILPLDAMDISFVGGADPYHNPGSQQSILEYSYNSGDLTSLFRLIGTNDTSTKLLSMKNLVVDGKYYIAHNVTYEQNITIIPHTTGGEYYECLKVKNTASDGIYISENGNHKTYCFVGENNGRGSITMTSAGSGVKIKNISTSPGAYPNVGGFHGEQDHKGSQSTGIVLDSINLDKGLFLTGCYPMNGVTITAKNITQTPDGTTCHTSLTGGYDSQITIEDSALYCSSFVGNSCCTYWASFTDTDSRFISLPDPGAYTVARLGCLGIIPEPTKTNIEGLSKTGSIVTVTRTGHNYQPGMRYRFYGITQANWLDLNNRHFTILTTPNSSSFTIDCGDATVWSAYLIADPGVGWAYGPSDSPVYTFNGSTFASSGLQAATTACYGVVANQDKSKTALINFKDTMFESSLNGAFAYWDGVGSPILIFDDCNFHCTTSLVNSIQTAILRLYGRNTDTTAGNGEFDITFKGANTIWGDEVTYFASFYNALAAWNAATDCVLKFSADLPNIPVAKSKIWVPDTTMPKGYSYYPENAIHPTEMTYSGGVVTVTAANHGLVTNDYIMFDRIVATGWIGLSPDSNVARHQITRDSDTQFRFSVSLSSPSAYSGYPTDKGVFWKQSQGCRRIIGNTGDDPTQVGNPAYQTSGFSGDIYIVPGGSRYYCRTTGMNGYAVWAIES
jgi:hypothetical protein